MLDKRMTPAEIVAQLRDGMTLGIGGWAAGAPSPELSGPRWPWANDAELRQASNEASSRHRVTTSQVVRSSVGFSSSNPSKPS